MRPESENCSFTHCLLVPRMRAGTFETTDELKTVPVKTPRPFRFLLAFRCHSQIRLPKANFLLISSILEKFVLRKFLFVLLHFLCRIKFFAVSSAPFLLFRSHTRAHDRFAKRLTANCKSGRRDRLPGHRVKV